MSQLSSLPQQEFTLPELPDKLFFSIREVSEICDVEPHVLRYWESEFRTINPVKKGGNRRFYRKKDVHSILHIKHLLYHLNFTIRGAKKVLMSGNLEKILEKPDARTSLVQVRQELADVLELLSD